MKANLGGVDRALRVLVGLALLAWLALGEGAAHWWGAVGFIPLLTALAGFCPLYRLFGLSTCPLSARI